MDFRIITLSRYEAEVCLHRSINEHGQYTVILTSFIFDEDDEDEEDEEETEIMLESDLVFPNTEMAQNFIDDYSEKSAVDWLVFEADKQGINWV